jgi:hypothetical protein
MTEPAKSARPGRFIAEGVLIVVSILLAFAIDAGWDEARDRAREDEYIALLRSDLRTTLATLDRFGPIADTLFDPANARLVRAYYEADLPPEDSIRAWFRWTSPSVGTPVALGTAEAMVATGDIALVRDESLRIAIGDYLRAMRTFGGIADGQRERIRNGQEDLLTHIDIPGLRLMSMSPEERDSLVRSDPLSPLPGGPLRTIPAPELREVVRDPSVHSILSRMLSARQNLREQRQRMRDQTEQLLAQVEAVEVG